MKPELLELLYLSFDADLTAEQKNQLDQALAESEELRQEKERLIQLRSSLADSASEFKPFFETRVMQRIQMEKPEQALNRLVESLSIMFRRVVLVGAACAIALAAINLSGSDEISVPALFAIQDTQAETIFQTPFEEFMEQ